MHNPDEQPSVARRPDFMIIGAMKSGTTTLYEYLDRHPGVFMCSPKEPLFFSREEVYARGLEWYFSLFGEAGSSQICGEASTCYSRWPHFGDVPARIKDAVPQARFIFVMRHPVERAYSHYRHEMQERQLLRGGKIVPFEAALAEVPEIVDASLYRVQIEKYLERFPRERLLLLFFEELTAQPGPVLDEVQRFLGLDHDPRLLEAKIAANAFGSWTSRRDMRILVDSIRDAPVVSAVRKLVPQPLRSFLRARLEHPSVAAFASRRRVQTLERQLTPLTGATRKQLLERFARPNQELEELMGRRVPDSWHA